MERRSMLHKFLKIGTPILTLACGFILGSGIASAQITIDPGPRSAVLHPTTNAPGGVPPVLPGWDCRQSSLPPHQ